MVVVFVLRKQGLTEKTRGKHLEVSGKISTFALVNWKRTPLFKRQDLLTTCEVFRTLHLRNSIRVIFMSEKKQFTSSRKGITYLDLFAGAGGFSEGFMQA